MTKNPKCESPNEDIECSNEPELFRTVVHWAGRKIFRTECLSHALNSEQRGRQTEVIRH